VAGTLSQRVLEWCDRQLPAEGDIALGYSGGGDSHALLCLLSDWARLRNRKLIAFIVNHGLRPESRAEAEQALIQAHSLDVDAEILDWVGEKPSAGVQAVARRARHGLLAAACKQHDVTALALGHTRDDQAETVWMRIEAGGGWRACAGMERIAPSPVWPEGRSLVLHRPLLDIDRESLRTWLGVRGEPWIDDPSNENPDFTRIAIRRRLASLRREGFDVDRLAIWSETLREERRRERRQTAGDLRDGIRITRWGGARLDPEFWRRHPSDRLGRALETLALAVSGRSAPARASAITALVEAVRDGRSATGGGVQVFTQNGLGWMIRDPGAMTGRVDRQGLRPIALSVGNAQVIDGRFEVDAGIDGVFAAPLGTEYSGLADTGWISQVPGAARAGLLAFRRNGEVFAIAGLRPARGLVVSSLLANRLAHRLFPEAPETWFDVQSETVALST
jgi:tRNA(Ile)-lysidine synthase